MRTTGSNCGVQQGLTTEAANIVKQAITLAKRRGHAQVTPLHVANTMLTITNGLFRTACLQSHSHPLQCKALELCFNVALNRLPATTCSSSSSTSMLGHHHSQFPCISNALVAAFKRAQAHQRRGSIENQQQPLLAVKIELEQLIISILDDPSVSRVMREAGFSSTQVKINVEQAVSLEICSQSDHNNNNKINNPSCDREMEEDIKSVIDNLKSYQRRSVVVVGECVETLEGVVKGVMDKVDKGGVGGDDSLRGVKFISLSLSSFANFSRVEVERKIEELRGTIVAKNNGKGCVLYLGDLKWLFDYRANYKQGIRGYYCPVDHMIIEIGKLSSSVGESSSSSNGIRFWLMCIATFQAYMRCKNGQPSLETLWGLHPITIPAGSLSLSLITDSGVQNQQTKEKDDNRTSWLLHEGVGDDNEIIQKQVRSLQSSACNSNDDSSNSTLPAWLQQYKNENNKKGTTINDHQNYSCVPVGDLCKQWNSMCDKTLTITLSSVSPSSSTSGFSYENYQHPHHITHPITKQSKNNHLFWISQSGTKPNDEPSLRPFIPESTSNPNSTSSSDLMEMEHISNFKELNLENMKTLCNSLEKKVPWQKDIIPEIVTTVLQCRSGMLKRKGINDVNLNLKEDTWLFFQGVDVEAKEKIARELARVIFGSQKNLVTLSLSSFTSTRADSAEECRNKRSRDETISCSYIERFGDAMCSNPHRVFVIEDIEQADYCSQLGFKRAIENGRVRDSNGEEVGFFDAIIILSCESFSSRSRASSPKQRLILSCQEQKEDHDDNVVEETTSPYVSLDLNIPIDDEDLSVDDIGLLESVDRKIVFKTQEL